MSERSDSIYLISHGGRYVRAVRLLFLGVIVGPLGNPFYVALAKGIETEVKKINPNAKVTAVSNDYDLNKDVTAMETFIASGTDIVFLDAADSVAIEPTVKKAIAAGVTVVGVDAGAKGAPVNLTVDNTAAGQIACDYLAEKLSHKGNVVIIDSVPMVAIAQQVRDYLSDGTIRNAVNMPALPPDQYRRLGPYMDLGQRLGAFVAQAAPSQSFSRIRIRYAGEPA